jgi:hypothetical protein
MRSDSMFQQGWYTFIPSRPELVVHPRAVSHPKAVNSTALNRPTLARDDCTKLPGCDTTTPRQERTRHHR